MREFDVAGHHLVLKQMTISQRSTMCDIAADELERIPSSAIISQTPKEPEKFDMVEPSNEIQEDGDKEQERSEEWRKYREAKERFDIKHAEDKPMVTANLWVPVRITCSASLDGHALKVFHTTRGPIMGMVTGEDRERAWIHSPCWLDPNLERGRIHYFPLAFGGFEVIIYKMHAFGESVPQEAEARGYPAFVEQNKKGDYAFRMKAAYHHIDADIPEDTTLVSAQNPRDALEGLLVTSDMQEKQAIEKVRQAKALQAQQASVQKID